MMHYSFKYLVSDLDLKKIFSVEEEELIRVGSGIRWYYQLKVCTFGLKIPH